MRLKVLIAIQLHSTETNNQIARTIKYTDKVYAIIHLSHDM